MARRILVLDVAGDAFFSMPGGLQVGSISPDFFTPVTFASGDTNGLAFLNTGREVIICKTLNGADIDIVGFKDRQGRSQDLRVDFTAADQVLLLGPFGDGFIDPGNGLQPGSAVETKGMTIITSPSAASNEIQIIRV